MTTYIIRRILLGIIILFLVTVLIFLLMRLLPGDPLLLILGTETATFSEEQHAYYMQVYGLDKPLVEQYFNWLGDVFHGNLGKSILWQGREVNDIIRECFPVTVTLGVYAFVISAVFGVLFGVICAVKRGKWLDTFFTLLANVGITLPNFWVGILLVYLLSLTWHLLPTFGYTSPLENFGMHLRQLVMPVFCLAVFPIAGITRQTRSSMLEVTRQDYVRTAWAKGLRERVIITRHIIKNGLIPVVTTLGMQVSMLFGGSVLIESVFAIPGMGQMMRDAAMANDYQLVQGGVLIIAVIIIITNLLVDITYGWLDPRIRYS